VAIVDASDHEEIRKLLARYCHATDSGDVEAFVGVFAPTASIRMAVTGETFDGIAAIRALIDERVEKNRELRHITTNESITVGASGEVASCVSYVQEYRQGHDGMPVLRWIGKYVDEFVKIGGEWLISLREVHIEFSRRRP
jgi:ketosteroid isomerase-like protein